MRWRVAVEHEDGTDTVEYFETWEAVMVKLLAINESSIFDLRITQYDPDTKRNLASRLAPVPEEET